MVCSRVNIIESISTVVQDRLKKERICMNNRSMTMIKVQLGRFFHAES